MDALKSQNVKTGGVAFLKDDERFIYYLITKTSTYQKPTYDSLTSSLEAMREHMVITVFNPMYLKFNGLPSKILSSRKRITLNNWLSQELAVV